MVYSRQLALAGRVNYRVSSHFHIQRCPIGSLKQTMERVLTPWEPASAHLVCLCLVVSLCLSVPSHIICMENASELEEKDCVLVGMINVPHPGLLYLDTWSPFGDAFWKGHGTFGGST